MGVQMSQYFFYQQEIFTKNLKISHNITTNQLLKIEKKSENTQPSF